MKYTSIEMQETDSYHIAWTYMYYSYQDVYFQLMPAIARQTQEMSLALDYIKLKKHKKTTHALHQRMLRSKASNIAPSKQTVVYTRTQKQHLDCIYAWILNSVEWFVHCMPRLWIPLSLSHPLGTILPTSLALHLSDLASSAPVCCKFAGKACIKGVFSLSTPGHAS